MRVAPLAVAAGLCGCQNMPPPYAPPVQRQAFEDYHPRVVRVVDMSDPDARFRFAQDFFDQPGPWRWTGKRPTIRVPVRSADNLHLVMDYAIADATFKTTGPVKIVIYVNDKVAAARTHSEPGQQHFDFPLPPGTVEANKDAVIAVEIDKVWVSPTDATELGFILSRIGLTQE